MSEVLGDQQKEHKRKPGDFSNYELQDDDTYTCKDCGGAIMAVTVTHPIHWRMMPGSGFGEVETSQAPYCPNCEETPRTNGRPMYYDF